MTVIGHPVGATAGRTLPRTGLLAAGIASSVLYVVMNAWAAAEWPAYSSSSQTISELSAIGAPTRPMWVMLGLLYSLMMIAFGVGLRRSAAARSNLRAAGSMVVIFGSVGLLWPFAPMHQRAVLAAAGGGLTDALHLTLGAVSVVLMLTAIGLAAASFTGRLRTYSKATVLLVLWAGTLTALAAPALGANAPTPGLGIIERLSVGAFLLWVIVVAAVMMRMDTRQEIP